LRIADCGLRIGRAAAVGLRLLAVASAACALASCAGQRPEPQQVTQAQTQAAGQPHFERPAGVLRVCADPNNLPFSNERGEGFENKLAEMLAADLGAELRYTWWAQRRGFFRNTLRAGSCDVVLGVPAGFELALTTSPYYRSTYAFVSRKDRHLGVRSFDDEALRRLKVGVQLVGDDGANTPPAHALARSTWGWSGGRRPATSRGGSARRSKSSPSRRR
jgi:ABC-type amino acid transport substrate-binding protein